MEMAQPRQFGVLADGRTTDLALALETARWPHPTTPSSPR
jgi:hypothetical protein